MCSCSTGCQPVTDCSRDLEVSSDAKYLEFPGKSTVKRQMIDKKMGAAIEKKYFSSDFFYNSNHHQGSVEKKMQDFFCGDVFHQ